MGTKSIGLDVTGLRGRKSTVEQFHCIEIGVSPCLYWSHHDRRTMRYTTVSQALGDELRVLDAELGYEG